jgi:hypothetical protein
VFRSQSVAVPLRLFEATHVRVLCDACRAQSAEVCGRREVPAAATVAAVLKFKSAGWHHDPGSHLRQKLVDDAERTGAGRWYCPECGRKGHL